MFTWNDPEKKMTMITDMETLDAFTKFRNTIKGKKPLSEKAAAIDQAKEEMLISPEFAYELLLSICMN